jgi:glutamyl-tRNA synthetase
MRVELDKLTPWSAASIHAALEAVCARLGVGLGKVAQPLRVAVSGGAVSPPIDATVALLGRDKTLARIERALAYIDKPQG